ncbi:hypothetical protein J4409_00240 [Candidatus Woesearchaeota archaeon]|nr:hypothetical protein [Candidatus Woesearchaeota archaeon]
MKYKTKSIIIGRKPRLDKDDYSNRPCFISFFDITNPHKNNVAPKKVVDFLKVNKVVIKGLDASFLLMGGDLLIDNLKEIEITEKEGNVLIVGKQGKED